MEQYLEITESNIEKIDKLVNKSYYGDENKIIHDMLNKFPKNDNLTIIAMKIATIDVTNSTHLSQYKEKVSLYDLADFILNIKDFDKRVKAGDPRLVEEIAKNNGKINLFSFASKYCTYHNVEIYQNDDYSIFDGIVKKMLPIYNSDITTGKIERWRQTYNYVDFNNAIRELLDSKNINIKGRRRKFDHFMWYPNRKK